MEKKKSEVIAACRQQRKICRKVAAVGELIAGGNEITANSRSYFFYQKEDEIHSKAYQNLYNSNTKAQQSHKTDVNSGRGGWEKI